MGENKETYESVVQQRDALAAENSALKASQGEIYDYTQQFTSSDDREMWNAMHDIYKLSSPLETPATDAFLADACDIDIPGEVTERDLFEEWVMESIFISKSTLEGMRTDGGYRNSTLSGRDYNGMWLRWKSVRSFQLRKGINDAQ